jgi:hypothetical protein
MKFDLFAYRPNRLAAFTLFYWPSARSCSTMRTRMTAALQEVGMLGTTVNTKE